jgi:hypothetical protein
MTHKKWKKIKNINKSLNEIHNHLDRVRRSNNCRITNMDIPLIRKLRYKVILLNYSKSRYLRRCDHRHPNGSPSIIIAPSSRYFCKICDRELTKDDLQKIN